MSDRKVNIQWKDKSKNVVDINELAQKIKDELKTQNQRNENDTFTSAQFALQMVQGAEKIRFVIIAACKPGLHCLQAATARRNRPSVVSDDRSRPAPKWLTTQKYFYGKFYDRG
ncbi:hypothetical protein [Lyngbya sp. PCC 8106]|uniref:hypothetical protein n=1 Tax=Lyngbya sp. (strain PCC 8106) TaxID=313612 RepID=UPI0000EA9C46|nr:hypothetical protein [Lyngbya sp. PCC 8106]EAW33433.1 hypothetical protein L8106_02832 [Lyngbya sp. PCC 8106]